MADPAYNRFRASGSRSDLKLFVESCCQLQPDGQLALDFERIIPIPAEVEGNAERVRDWKIRHWSTGWVLNFQTEERTATRLVLRFGSAGTPPENVYRELARRFPKIKFAANFVEGANNFAHIFRAHREVVTSIEREATDDDWEAATGETVEEMDRSAEAARAAWEAQNPRSRSSKPITHPRFWLRHWRVRRALKSYPIYDVPHKKAERDLPEAQARENFDYFMRVRLERLTFFQSWLRNNFSADASLTPAGVHGVNRWVDQFGGGLIGDDTSHTPIFVTYEPRWEGPFAGYNVIVDLGIFMGEFIILRRPRVRWEMDQGKPSKSVSSQSAGYRKPCLAGFPRGWTNKVIESGNECIEDSHQASKVGDRASDLTNVVLRVVRSALYIARLPDGNDPIIFGDSSNEQL